MFYQGAQPQVVLTNDDLQAQIQTAKIELNDLRKDAIVKLSNFVKHMNSGSVADLVIFGKSLPNAGTGGQIKKLIDVVNVNLKQAAMNIQ